MTTFDNLWEQEEKQGLQRRLQQEYTAWQQRRHVRRTAVVSLAAVTVVVLVTLSTFHFPLSTRSYDSVACNRSGIADAQWVAVAGHVLTIETL